MKSYLDALHPMQGQGASVVRDNATSAAKLGVEVGLAIDGGLAGTSGVPKGTATRPLPSSLPENLTGYANPADIRFTQNSVSNTFKDGQSLQATIDGLKSGKI